jgi:quercetin dioxygenase-like cupin family protein
MLAFDVIEAGNTIENPATGARLVFRKTAHETGGRAVVVEVLLPPNGLVPRLYVHPHQQKRVEVLAGSVGAHIGRHRTVVGPGARLTVLAGTAHCLWNAGDETAHLVAEITPALAYESLVETLFSLAADGCTNGAGLPSPLRFAVVAAAHFDTFRLAFPPAPVQRLALVLAAPVGRALGYRAGSGPAASTAIHPPTKGEERRCAS